MLFSRNWIGAYVELPADVGELARLLTFAGLAVEGIEEAGDDLLLDIDVTTNRPDCMNHLGLAREVAVLSGQSLAPPVGHAAAAGGETAAAVDVHLDDGQGCPRYVARVVEGVRVEESPAWLRERLTSLGLRPINSIVDVTNFVLWETGQPLHAFDLSKIAGAEIRVRRARSGERLLTLDGEERSLDPEILVIADAARPVALAGVMGGLDSEVGDDTVDVLVESAHFDRRRVRIGAGRFAMHTDASHRFERGADPGACAWAAERAAVLMAEVAGGRILDGAVDARSESFPQPRQGTVDLAALDRFAGTEIPPDTVEGILDGLGFAPAAADDGRLQLTVPSWRHYDFEPRPEPPHQVYPADVYEEVLRIHGFEQIPAALPALPGSDGPPTAAQVRRERIRDHLAGCGYAEAIHFAFHDSTSDAALPAPVADGAAVELVNPLSERYAVLRRSLVPNLVEGARFNRRRGLPAVQLFEIGHVFAVGEEGVVEGVVERQAVALVAGGELGTPWDRRVEFDLFDLKGAVESLAGVLGASLEAWPAELPGLVPGAAAELTVGDRPVGYLGRLAEETEEFPLFVAELATEALTGTAATLEVTLPSRYPGIHADLTLTHARDVPWRDLRAAIASHAPEHLVECGLKDRYAGKGVPDGAVNTTIYFLYNSEERSLTQEEVNERQHELTAELERRFGWEG